MYQKNKLLYLKQNGFTLMEMLLYMAIFSIFLLVTSQIFVSALDVQTESEATSSVNQDGRFILSKLTHDIRRSSNILQPANLGEVANTLQIEIEGLDYTYSLDTANLELAEGGETNNLNSFDTQVSDFRVERIGNLTGLHNLKISFTLTSKTTRKKGPEIQSFQTTIGLR